MDNGVAESPSPTRPTRHKWRKVAYGGMQPGFDDNHTDESFLEDMVMNANVVKRDMLKVMQDAVSISEYLCIVALVGLVWTYTLRSSLNETNLLYLDVGLLGSGLLVFVTVVCPYWLIRLQEYKFEINGPWDEAKLCFAVTD